MLFHSKWKHSYLISGDDPSAECSIDAPLIAVDTPLKVEVPASNGLDISANHGNTSGAGVEEEAIIVLDTPLTVEDATDFWKC